MGFFKTLARGVRNVFGSGGGLKASSPNKSLRQISQERQAQESANRKSTGWGGVSIPRAVPIPVVENRPIPRSKTEAEEEADVMRVLNANALASEPSLSELESAAEKMLRAAGANDRENEYLLGEVIEVSSSNVSWIQYLWKYPGQDGEPLGGTDQNELFIGYQDGSVYQYEAIDFDLALAMFRANSHGKWVWDNLRVRGTVFGYQKPYRLVSGHRIWNAAGEESQARHEAIPKSGEEFKGYHPSMNYKGASGRMGAEGINLGKKGSAKKAYFLSGKAKTEHYPKSK